MTDPSRDPEAKGVVVDPQKTLQGVDGAELDFLEQGWCIDDECPGHTDKPTFLEVKVATKWICMVILDNVQSSHCLVLVEINKASPTAESKTKLEQKGFTEISLESLIETDQIATVCTPTEYDSMSGELISYRSQFCYRNGCTGAHSQGETFQNFQEVDYPSVEGWRIVQENYHGRIRLGDCQMKYTSRDQELHLIVSLLMKGFRAEPWSNGG